LSLFENSMKAHASQFWESDFAAVPPAGFAAGCDRIFARLRQVGADRCCTCTAGTNHRRRLRPA
jgi:hypothetical protein